MTPVVTPPTLSAAIDPRTGSFIVTGSGAEIMAGLMTLPMARSMHREALSVLAQIEAELVDARAPLLSMRTSGNAVLDRICTELAAATRVRWIVLCEAKIERVRDVVAKRAAQVAALELEEARRRAAPECVMAEAAE